MKLVKTEEAVGHVLCHDMTQIIPGVSKDARFRKGHIVTQEDIPVLLSMGKKNLYVWEKRPGILHEDEAAEILFEICHGANTCKKAPPKEGKIELLAACDGLLKINREKLLAVNSLTEMMIATRAGDFAVKKGDLLAATRIIPLVIDEEKMAAARAAAGPEPIVSGIPFGRKKSALSPREAKSSAAGSRTLSARRSARNWRGMMWKFWDRVFWTTRPMPLRQKSTPTWKKARI